MPPTLLYCTQFLLQCTKYSVFPFLLPSSSPAQSRRKTVAKILDELDAMTYEELEGYLEAQRIRRRPRKTLFSPMKAVYSWKNEEAEELDRSAGVIEYDSKLLEAFKRQ